MDGRMKIFLSIWSIRTESLIVAGNNVKNPKVRLKTSLGMFNSPDAQTKGEYMKIYSVVTDGGLIHFDNEDAAIAFCVRNGMLDYCIEHNELYSSSDKASRDCLKLKWLEHMNELYR